MSFFRSLYEMFHGEEKPLNKSRPTGAGVKRARKPFNTSKERNRRMRQIKNQLAKLEAKQENP